MSEHKHKYKNICYFDTETTALDTSKAKIIEISLRNVDGTSSLTKFVNPEEKIENSFIHGITNDIIEQNGGKTFKDIVPEIETWVKGVYGSQSVYMLAHNNIYYDKLVLEHEYARCGFKIPNNWLFIDSYQQIREIYPSLGRGKYKLTALYEACSAKPLENAHRAEADTNALATVYSKMVFDRFKHNYFYWLKNGPFIEKSVFSPNYSQQNLRSMPLGLYKSEIYKLQASHIHTFGDLVELHLINKDNPNYLIERKLAKYSSNRLIKKVIHFLKIIS